MRLRLILGSILSVFILLLVPSINAIEYKVLSEENKSLFNLYVQRFSKGDLIDFDNVLSHQPKGFIINSILIIALSIIIGLGLTISLYVVTFVIALLIYIYVSNIIGPEPAPLIQFVKDDYFDKLVVATVSRDNVLWSNIDVQGNCDTSQLGKYVEPYDQITSCHGIIDIYWKPTDTLMVHYEFDD